ncbi:MAG: hypothetical protein JXB85_16575 [Anaerolineales bacterium]|nr:hypothetical protein [Anaerolineales bacterium]
MFKAALFLTLLLAAGGAHPAGIQPQDSEPAVVRAVLFYSPNCGHCAYVINDVLPPLFERYGDQLQMMGINVSSPEGQTLFFTAVQMFNIEQAGVPFLVIGDTYLFGSVDIPERFPGLIEYYLSQGGVDWPAIPGLAEVIAMEEESQGAVPSPTAGQAGPAPVAVSPEGSEDPQPAPVSETPAPFPIFGEENPFSLQERLARDPVGNGLAIIVLLGMLVSLAVSGVRFSRIKGRKLQGTQAWAIPILCVIGLGVAGYLAYVETTHTEAVCGPVGDCNTVQQSKYALLFGVLPIGVLGMAGYVLILAAWAVERSFRGVLSDYAALAILGMAIFGTVFSIYLTFLEPFVIGATCAWCLTSAIIMTALLLLSLAPGKRALTRWNLKSS